MNKQIHRIGVLTSGGDCAGLNAVIRAVTYRAVREYGWTVVGVLDGSAGLLDRPPRTRELGVDTFGEQYFRVGGTFLGSVSRGDPLHYRMPDGSVRDRSDEFAAGVRQIGIDALVVIGGDGSMRILSKLCAHAGIPMVGVPKTIDNDVHGTDFAVGFLTAADVVRDALDRLQPTAASHHRAMVLEVMGRDAGHLAMAGGVAGGADVILVPEIPYRLDAVCARIRETHDRGGSHALIVVAEGVGMQDGGKATQIQTGGEIRYGGIGQYLAQQIGNCTGIDTRVTLLGHVQRGGSPTTQDRLLASAFGVHAVDLLARGQYDRMCASRGGEVRDVPLDEVTIGARPLNLGGTVVKTALGLGVYIGDLGG